MDRLRIGVRAWVKITVRVSVRDIIKARIMGKLPHRSMGA